MLMGLLAGVLALSLGAGLEAAAGGADQAHASGVIVDGPHH